MNVGMRIFYNARIITITTILFAVTIATAFSAYSYLPEVYADNSLRQVIEINGTYPAGVDVFTVAISPPLQDINKAVAFITFEYNQQNQHRDTFRSWNFTDASTLTIYGNDQTPSANFAVGFHGTIFEFTADSDAFVQHLEFEIAPLAAEGEFEVSIPIAVNASTAFLVQAGNFHQDVDTTVGVEEFSRIRIINGTFYGVLLGDTPNTGPMQFHNSIVDLNTTGVNVQRGLGTIDSGETIDTFVPTAYNKTNTILFVSYSTNGMFSQDPEDVAVKATINGADNIIIQRTTASVDTVDYSFQLIEFEDGFLVAQHFNGTQADGTTDSFATIPTPVGNFSRSWAIGTVSSPFGFGNGLSDSTTNGGFDRTTATITLENATHVELVRGTGTDSYEVGLQVIEFLPPISNVTAFTEIINDNTNVTDTTVLNLTKILNDNSNATDTFSLNTTKVLNDNSNVTDSVNAVLMQFLNQTIDSANNNANVTDSVVLAINKVLIGDNVNATDTFSLNSTKVLNDNANVTDSVNAVLMQFLNQTIDSANNNANVTDSVVLAINKTLLGDIVNATDTVNAVISSQALNQTISNATNFVDVTETKILNTTKVLGTGVSGGATSACSSGIGTSALRACYTFDTADISNDTATNSGTLGTLADAEYFSDSIKSPFVINATGIIAQAVLQNGTNDDGTPFAPGRTQGEIRLVNSTNISEFNFIHTLTGSNLTSINFWIFGDVDGAAEYPLITSMSQNAGEDSGMNLHTRGADMCLNLGVNGSFVVNNSCVIGGPIPADDGQWHMVTLLMDKGNTTSFAKIYIDGSAIGTINGNAFPTDVEDSFRELKIGGTEFASSRVETTWFVDDFAIWNGYQLTDSDITTLFNTTSGDVALVTVTDSIVTQLSQILNQTNNDNANVTDAHILDTIKVLNDTDTTGGGGGSGTAIANLVSNTYENIEQLDVLSIGGAGTFEGFVGNIYDDEENPIYTNPVKITGIYANIGSVVNSGTMSMLIATNASVGSNPSDMVIVAVSDESIDLSNFPQVPGLPNAINDETNKPVLWNFTSQPTITFTNNTFIGFNFTDVVASIGANAIDIEAWSAGGFGNGQCYTANTTASETFANCIVPILGYEINVLVENVDDWETTSGIEVGKLVVHHTFDDAQLYDSGEDKALYRNAGTLQGRADASALIETGTQGKDDSSITGLLGEAFFMSEPIIGNDEGYMTVGFSDYDRIQDFNFINDNVTDTFSINVWVRGNWTTQSVDYIPIVSNLYADSAFGFLLGMGSSGEANLDIISNELSVIGNANTTGTVNDDDWAMLTMIVEKSNATSTVQLCLDSVCESKDRVNPYIEYGILSNKLIVADTNVNNFDLLVGRSPPIGIMIDELCIWEDYKLTSTDLSTLYNSGSGANCGTVTQTSGGGSGNTGVIVTDSVNALLMQSLNQTNNDNANVTDANILNMTKVLNDTDTSGGGGSTPVVINWSAGNGSTTGYRIYRTSTELVDTFAALNTTGQTFNTSVVLNNGSGTPGFSGLVLAQSQSGTFVEPTTYRNQIITDFRIAMRNDTGNPVTSVGLIGGALYVPQPFSADNSTFGAPPADPSIQDAISVDTVSTADLTSTDVLYRFNFRDNALYNITLSALPSVTLDLGFGVFQNTSFTGDVTLPFCTAQAPQCTGFEVPFNSGGLSTFTIPEFWAVGSEDDLKIEVNVMNQTKLKSPAIPFVSDTSNLLTTFSDSSVSGNNTYFYTVVQLVGASEGVTLGTFNGTTLSTAGGGGTNQGVIVTDSVATLLEQSLNQTISNATNFVNVTDAHILDTIKVLNDTGGGAITNIASYDNLGTVGSSADAIYAEFEIPSFFQVAGPSTPSGGGHIIDAVTQNGTSSLQTNGEIYLGSTNSTWDFFHRPNTGSNLTSINMWINGDTVGSAFYPILTNQPQSNGNGFQLGTDQGRLILLLTQGGGLKFSLNVADFPVEPPDDGQWHMLSVSYDKGNVTRYLVCVDAVCEGQTPFSSGTPFTATSVTSIDFLTIGSDADHLTSGGVVENTFDVDDVAIWNGHELTQSDITTLFNSGNGTVATTISPSNLVGYWSFDNSTANGDGGAGVTVTDSVNALLMLGLNQTVNDNANVTDAHILNTTKVILTESGGVATKLTPIMNTLGDDTVSVDFFTEVNPTGFIGHLLDDSGVSLGTTYSVEAITIFFADDPALKEGNMTGIILNNVTIGGGAGSEIVIATTETVDVKDLSALGFVEPFSLTFNFTTPVPITIDHTDFIGIKIENANSTFPIGLYAEGTGGIAEGICIVQNSTSWQLCGSVPLSSDFLAMEFVISDTANLFETTGGIEPDKLVVHLTFDNEQNVNIAGINPDPDGVGVNTTTANAGTFGSNADGTSHQFKGIDSSGIPINQTGLLGQAWSPQDPENTVIIGHELTKNQFDFFSAINSTDTWSVNFWVKLVVGSVTGDFANPSEHAILMSSISSQDSSGMAIYTEQNELSVRIPDLIEVGILSGIAFTNSTSDWQMASVIVEKSNVTSTALVCVDTICGQIDRNFAGNNIPADHVLSLGEFDANILSGDFITNLIEFEMDEVCIWEDYKLTQSDLNTLYNSGNGAVCGTVSSVSGGGAGGFNNIAITTDTVNAFISSVNHTQTIDNNVNVTDTVIISADFNQTVGTVDNNVNVTDSVAIINSKDQIIPSGTNTAIISDSIVLNFTKFLDDESAISDNATVVNATAIPGVPPPSGGGSGGGGGVPTFLGPDPLSASLTGISLTLSKPEHTLSTEIIINPFFTGTSELGTVILNWDQQEPIQITGIKVQEGFEEFVQFARPTTTLEFAGEKLDPEDTFSTGILAYEVKIPSLALGVTQNTNPFGAAVEFFSFIQLVFTNQYTIPITVDAIHDGKPFQFNGEIVINHIKEVRWVVIALTIAGGVFLAIWGQRYFSATTSTKTGSFRKNLDKARRATVDKQKPGSFRKELEQQRRADRKKLKRK